MGVAAENGYQVPDEDLPPDVLPECEFVFSAFWELSTDRPVGMGIGAIPWSSINSFAVRHGIEQIDDFEQFSFLIRAIDAEYLKVANKK